MNKYWKVDWYHYNTRVSGGAERAYKFIQLISKKSNQPTTYSYFTTDKVIALAATIGIELTREHVNDAMQYKGAFGRIEGTDEKYDDWNTYDVEWRGIELKKDIEW